MQFTVVASKLTKTLKININLNIKSVNRMNDLQPLLSANVRVSFVAQNRFRHDLVDAR